MAELRKKKAGWAGAGAVLYYLISLVLDVLGVPADLDRWRVAFGQFGMSGLSVAFREVALLVGLMLMTPIVGEVVSNAWRGYRQRKEAERQAKLLTESHLRDIQDFLTAIAHDSRSNEILDALLRKGSDEFDRGDVEYLERAGIVELVSPTLDSHYVSTGVYRLCPPARPVVAAMRSDSMPKSAGPPANSGR